MASIINTSTSVGGLVSTGDSSNELVIKTNDTAAITIDGSQNVALSAGLTVNGATAATTTGTQTLTNKTITNLVLDGNYTEEVYTNSGSTLEPDNGTIQVATLSGNVTYTDGLSSGQSLVLMLNGGASYTVTWPTMTWVGSGGNVAPTLTANDVVVLWKVSTTLYGAWVGSAA